MYVLNTKKSHTICIFCNFNLPKSGDVDKDNSDKNG